MSKRELILLCSGWLAFFYVSFCAPSDPQKKGLDLPLPSADAADREFESDLPPLALDHSGIWVVDSQGKSVGLLVSRSHRLYENKELYDAVVVYNPDFGIFFAISMSTGNPLLPAKVMFSKGGCTGKVGVRAMCADCVTGYDLAFSYNNSWYRVDGGQKPTAMQYVTYVSEDPSDTTCISHGSSGTQVYTTTPLPAGMNPGKFEAPLEFRFVSGR